MPLLLCEGTWTTIANGYGESRYLYLASTCQQRKGVGGGMGSRSGERERFSEMVRESMRGE